MLLRNADLASIHRYCSRHKPLLEQSVRAGCVCCGESFAPSEIREWIREEASDVSEAGDTAKCPRCGVRAVLPSAAPVHLDARSLAALQSYWFSGRSPR